MFFILLDREAPDQRSVRSCTSVASYATCWGDLTVGDGR